MKKVLIYDITPCGRRKLDAKKLSIYFEKNGYKIVRKPEKADFIIINTCAYSDERAMFAINKIKELQKYKAELIVAGCLSGIEKDKLSEVFDGKTITTKDINNIDNLFPHHKIKFDNLPDENIFWQNKERNKALKKMRKLLVNNSIINAIRNFLKNNLRKELNLLFFSKDEVFHIQISQGCSANCAYCAIRNAIGKHKSKPFEECISEVKRGILQGYKKLFITADDSGCYGTDIGRTFPELLKSIVEIDQDFTIGIESVRPEWIIKYQDEIEPILKTGKIDFIGCSVQSGSERILKLMHRNPDVQKVKTSILRLKEAYSKLILITEIIIGFPTETEEEFHQTIDLLKDLPFDIGYIYAYSDRSGTDAEKITPKIPPKEISRRMNYSKRFLRSLGYNVRFERTKTVLVFSN